MFFKNMEQVSVQVDETKRYITVSQLRDINDPPSEIMISPEQIDGIISWLKEAKDYVESLNDNE